MSKDKILVKESTRYPGLFVHKYARHVFYKGTWDDECVEARGRVEDADGNVVIRPFTKIFNRFERDTDIPLNEMVLEVDKVNGFMAAATYIDSVGAVVVSTTGSLDSDFVTMAEEIIPESAIQWIKDFGRDSTWLFEIVHPDDPHIIMETTGAYLIGGRYINDTAPYHSTKYRESVFDMVADEMGGVLRAVWREVPFSEVVDTMKTYRREGAVVYSATTSLKIKTPYYLILKLLARKKDIMTLDITRVDEEYYGVVAAAKANPDFPSMDEKEKLEFMAAYIKNNQ